MFRGRYQLGEEAPLALLCLDSAGRPANPDAAPQVDIYGPSGKVLTGKYLPQRDPAGATGLFAMGVFLGALFSTGRHAVVYRWTTGSGSFAGSEVDTFEVVAGGDPKGAVLAMHFVDRPQATWVMQQLDSGRLVKGRNPRL